jgi:hypothetical protein
VRVLRPLPVTVVAVAILLASCTGDPSAERNPIPSPTSSEQPATAETWLTRAQAALRDAAAVRISSQAEVAQGAQVSTQRWRSLWSSKPTWIAATKYPAQPGVNVKSYGYSWRYWPGHLESRFIVSNRPPTPWGAMSINQARTFGPPGLTVDNVDVYPVAIVMLATAVDVVATSDGAVIVANAPTSVSDAWFGTADLLAANGWSGAAEGGDTEIGIFVDAHGFPFKVSYTGDDVELSKDIPPYMRQNLAMSGVTTYYRRLTATPRRLQAAGG